MSASPREVWNGLAPALRQEFVQELNSVIQEVLHEHFRFDSAAPSRAPRQHLRAAVESAPSGLESRKFAVAVRIAAAGKRTRMA